MPALVETLLILSVGTSVNEAKPTDVPKIEFMLLEMVILKFLALPEIWVVIAGKVIEVAPAAIVAEPLVIV